MTLVFAPVTPYNIEEAEKKNIMRKFEAYYHDSRTEELQ
jgi:hypothetical protein